MIVKLSELKPNPFRDLRVDPIDPEVVAALKESIEHYGFWGGVVCRSIEDEIQIAAGHHRIIAALEAGIEEVEIAVRDDLSDLEMIQIYATENATQRGNTSTAQAGSVASALKFVARAILTENYGLILSATFVADKEAVENKGYSIRKLRDHLLSDNGIGEHVLWDSGILSNVKGISQRVIRDQLTILKSSGIYARIIAEVQAEVEQEHQEVMAALEAARLETERLAEEARQAEERRKAMEAERQQKERERQARLAELREQRRIEEERVREEKRKAEEERKAASAAAKEARDQAIEREREAKRMADEERAAEKARLLQAKIEEEERLSELAKQQADVERERERIEAELAEKRRREMEGERERLNRQAESSQRVAAEAEKAKAAAAKRVVNFDFEGVSKHFKSANHINIFRQSVTSPGIAPYLPKENQAELAGHLVALAEKQGVELTGPFIRQNITAMLFNVKTEARSMNAQERAEILRRDKLLRIDSLQDDAMRSFWHGVTALNDLTRELKDMPKGMPFRWKPEWRALITAQKKVIGVIEKDMRGIS